MGNERDCPGDRIRHIEREDGPVQLEDGAYPYDPQAACARKRHERGDDGKAYPPQGTAGDIHHAAEEVRQADDDKALIAEGDYVLFS